jgi:hypothetical protein
MGTYSLYLEVVIKPVLTGPLPISADLSITGPGVPYQCGITH